MAYFNGLGDSNFPSQFNMDEMQRLSYQFAISSLGPNAPFKMNLGGMQMPPPQCNPFQTSAEVLMLQSSFPNMFGEDSEETSSDDTESFEDSDSSEDEDSTSYSESGYEAVSRGAGVKGRLTYKKPKMKYPAKKTAKITTPTNPARKSCKPLTRFPKSSGKKGWVLIIVNSNFEKEKYIPRGVETDELKALFKEFNYNVASFDDLCQERMLGEIRKIARRKDCKRFICFIASHGDVSSVCCWRGSIKIEKLYQEADIENLRTRPKCFFFDICRNKGYKDRLQPPSIPSRNFLVGLSCLAGTESKIGVKYKSVYLGHIYEIFNESFRLPLFSNNTTRDIDYLMKKVSRDVYLHEKQEPMYESSLGKSLFLQD